MIGMFTCRCGAQVATRSMLEFHLDHCPMRVIRVSSHHHHRSFFHRIIEWVLG